MLDGARLRAVAPWALALLVTPLLVLAPALRGDFLWDDDQYLSRNPTLEAPDALRRVWLEPRASPQYYPLVFTGFLLERAVWGLEPLGYHLVNALLHGASAVLLWQLLRRLVPAAPEGPFAGAWAAGLLFAVHPVTVESVAWITERKNTLSTCCYLAAALCYLRFSGVDAPPGGRRPWGWWAAALLLFVCALLSKTVTATLPAALLVVLTWRRGRFPREELLPLLPLFLLGLGAGLFTAWLEVTHVGAEGATWELAPAQRLLLAGRAPWFYLGKLVCPWPLVFVYPRWTLDPGDPLQWAWPAATLLLLGGLVALRRRLGGGPLATALLFGGGLFPALGFFDVYPFRFSWVADHFQYLACLAPLGLAGLGLGALGARRPGLAQGLLIGLAVVLGGLSWRRAEAFTGPEALWRDTLDRNPDAFLAMNNLGLILAARGDLDGAQALFEAAVAAGGEDEAELNLIRVNGLQMLRRGRPAQAIPWLEQALLHVPPDQPLHRDWLVELGQVLERAGQPAQARARYERVLALDPTHPGARAGLARLGQPAREAPPPPAPGATPAGGGW